MAVFKRWNVLSARPRASHAAIDGEEVGIDDTFSNGLRFPGDPSGGAAETAGCTCVLSISGQGAGPKEPRDFSDLDDEQVVEVWENYHDDWRGGLSPADRALSDRLDGKGPHGWDSINDALRNGGSPSRMSTALRDAGRADDFIARAGFNLPEDWVLWRQAPASVLDAIDEGFPHFSMSPEFAALFADEAGETVLMRVLTPRGMPFAIGQETELTGRLSLYYREVGRHVEEIGGEERLVIDVVLEHRPGG